MTAANQARRALVGNAIVVALLLAVAAWWFVREGAWRWPDIARGRWIGVTLVIATYAAWCATVAFRTLRAARPAVVADDAIVVAFATQTGFAEELATQAAHALRAAGRRVTLTSLARVDVAMLASTRLLFLVVATHGDGEPPDPARRFARDVLRDASRDASLDGLHFGLLALGDRSYARFCGFAREVEAWLVGRGAQPLFDAVDVDHGAPAALAMWRERLRPWTDDGPPGATSGRLSRAPASAPFDAPRFARWRLVERRWSNEGSVGLPVFRLAFAADGPARDWQAGDIAVVRLPDGSQRDYSIASLPSDGRIELLVRRALRPDGSVGLGAARLTSAMRIGDTIDLRIRTNHGFRLEGVGATTPLILIGNGTGIAGLRAHLKQRERDAASRNWLVFGERQAAFDRHYGDEIDAWLRSGTLERASLAFSRDGPSPIYVQQRLDEARDDVAGWIADGAAVLVCGSATGMAPAVDAALRGIVGDASLDEVAAEGRYRRDVY